eukprot:CAMPEP_0113715718 /NCGR_PEP_ID=MMETSP0038_2-20120614/33441_1 /TAXON_ID=2898 /ORGANISM="Cryptomonas paramecium" /LENGTH=184 /DNA_ID=CAMNT_0000643063 /DNA_START=81 /DNA_END=632 /DNA_ORIENTATION=- /assembly_acc=CAM_ASM_000170
MKILPTRLTRITATCAVKVTSSTSRYMAWPVGDMMTLCGSVSCAMSTESRPLAHVAHWWLRRMVTGFEKRTSGGMVWISSTVDTTRTSRWNVCLSSVGSNSLQDADISMVASVAPTGTKICAPIPCLLRKIFPAHSAVIVGGFFLVDFFPFFPFFAALTRSSLFKTEHDPTNGPKGSGGGGSIS